MSSPSNSILSVLPEPCFFYNMGGCYHPDGRPKSAKDCNFLHIETDYPIEKPQHLKIPCVYYHLQKNCTNDYCKYGHCELSENRWKRAFGDDFPGEHYSLDCTWSRNVDEKILKQKKEEYSQIDGIPLTKSKIIDIIQRSGLQDYTQF